MNNSDFYIESCTLHDDQYLTYHDLYENRSDNDQVCTSKSRLSAGGFSFNLKNDNRFILWRISGSTLELIEQSITHKLNGNCLRIDYKNAMLIPKINIYKQNNDHGSFNVLILVATTSKLYRLVFPFNNNEHASNSIFYNISTSTVFNSDPINNFQINLNQVENVDTFITPRGEALFAFILPNASLCCVQMPSNLSSQRQQAANANNQTLLPFKFEINQQNIVKRLWSGITRNQESQAIFVSYKFFSIKNQIYLMSLCKDFKLKIWCLKSNQCIHSEDLVRYIKSENEINWTESRIDIISYPDYCLTTVVIAYNDQFKICNLQIELNDSSLLISEISKRIIVKNGELIDVCLTYYNTWIMYKNDKDLIEIATIPTYENNRSNIRQISNIQIINVQGRNKQLKKRIKQENSFGESYNQDDDDEDDEDEFDDERIIDGTCMDMDLKEIYLHLIFEPFRFSKHSILKSLSILRHSIYTNDMAQQSLSLDEIKEIIIKSIEKEVQNHPSFSNCNEEEFLLLNSKCWSKYYTMLKQYDYDSRVPLGLYVDPFNESLIVLIRKNSMSTYNKADLTQHYHLSQIESIRSCFNEFLLNTDQADTDLSDLYHFLMSIRCINEYLNAQRSVLNTKFNVEDSSRLSKTTFQYIQFLTDHLTQSNQDFLRDFCDSFDNIKDLNSLDEKFKILFSYFDTIKLCVTGNTSGAMDENEDYLEMDTDNFFTTITSDFTIDVTLASFRELLLNHYEFFRDLSIFINVLARFHDKLNVPRLISNKINQNFYEQSLNYFNSYKYLKWLSEIYPYRIEHSQKEKSVRRTVDLLENFSAEGFKSHKDYNQTLLRSFMLALGKFSISSSNNSLYNTNFARLNQHFHYNILSFLWPLNSETNYDLVKYLMQNIQYIHLSNYCSEIKWWLSGKNLRYFLLAHCCLYFDNIDQSIGLFLKASLNLDKEHHLNRFMNLIRTQSIENQANRSNLRRSIIMSRSAINRSVLNNSTHQAGNYSFDNENKILLDYYTRVIHYYDLNGNLEAAIELIQNALLSCQFDAASKSKLYCILFKSYMDLEYFDKAHMALMSNMDSEWKRTCLKHFISELCNQNKTSILVSFDYGDMLQEVLNILYKRAQNTDLRANDYYRVLYAVYVKIKDYRKAAFCMYECATRLKREINGISSLKRQEKCYLACLNLLKLVDKKLAWLAIPVKHDESALNLSPSKILNSTKDINDKTCISNELDDLNLNYQIVNVDDINRSYLTVFYMIKISSQTSNQNSIVEELVGLLVKYGLFDDAITLCLAFKPVDSSPLVSVINGLVDRCCNFGNVINTENDDISNEVITEYELIKNNDSLPVSITPYENPCSFKWKLLHMYLEKFNDVTYYKCACKRIIMLGYELPQNIISSFKKLNTNALLQIYVTYGYWEDAFYLVKDYINAVSVNDGINRFDLKNSLSSKNSSVALPYTIIDTLLLSFSKSNNPNLKNMHKELKEKVENYLKQISSSTESFLCLNRTTQIR